LHHLDYAFWVKPKKTFESTLNVINSQMVKIQRLKFNMVLVQVVGLKILRLEVQKKLKHIETYINFHKVLKNRSFWFWKSQNTLGL
jgi:hypothetical protein